MLPMLKRRVLHRLAQVNLSPEDGQRLSERLETDEILGSDSLRVFHG
jgi:hypothetical protein